MFGYLLYFLDKALAHELEVFRKVQGITDECVPGFPDTGSGNRRVCMEMAWPVPNLLRVGEKVVQCEYDDVVHVCQMRDFEVHLAAACELPKCMRSMSLMLCRALDVLSITRSTCRLSAHISL